MILQLSFLVFHQNRITYTQEDPTGPFIHATGALLSSVHGGASLT